MGVCEKVLRSILVLINVIVVAAGTLLIVVGSIFYTKKVDDDIFSGLKEYGASFSTSTAQIPVLVLGSLLVLVGMAGFFGACSGKKGLLNIYIACLVVIIVLQIALLIFGVVTKDSSAKRVKRGVEKLFSDYKKKFVNGDVSIKMTEMEILAINLAQKQMKCCGITDGPTYWKSTTSSKVPPGCCSDWDRKMPTSGEKLVDCKTSSMYTKECLEQVEPLYKEDGVISIIINVTIIVFEVLCIIAAYYSKKKEIVA